MSKELEILEELKSNIQTEIHWYNQLSQFREEEVHKYDGNFDTIKQALQRLEAIDNSKSSKALIGLHKIGSSNYFFGDPATVDKATFNTIEQALLKSQELERLLDHERELNNHLILKEQEQEKVLKIIFEKNVNFEVFGAFETYKDYEIYYNKKFHIIEHKLTEEEFNLVKRWTNGNISSNSINM